LDANGDWGKSESQAKKNVKVTKVKENNEYEHHREVETAEPICEPRKMEANRHARKGTQEGGKNGCKTKTVPGGHGVGTGKISLRGASKKKRRKNTTDSRGVQKDEANGSLKKGPEQRSPAQKERIVTPQKNHGSKGVGRKIKNMRAGCNILETKASAYGFGGIGGGNKGPSAP